MQGKLTPFFSLCHIWALPHFHPLKFTRVSTDKMIILFLLTFGPYLSTIGALQQAKWRFECHGLWGSKCVKHQLSRKFRQMHRSTFHPYLALSNEVVLITPGVSMPLCCFCLIKLNLQLPRSNWGESKHNGIAYLFACLSVWDNLSLGETPAFNLCFFFPLFRLSPCGFLLLSTTACLSPCLWFSISLSIFKYFPPHSCGAQADWDENKN